MSYTRDPLAEYMNYYAAAFCADHEAWVRSLAGQIIAIGANEPKSPSALAKATDITDLTIIPSSSVPVGDVWTYEMLQSVAAWGGTDARPVPYTPQKDSNELASDARNLTALANRLKSVWDEWQYNGTLEPPNALAEATQRANALSDECQMLRDENRCAQTEVGEAMSDETMPEADVLALLARADAATPPPWDVRHSEIGKNLREFFVHIEAPNVFLDMHPVSPGHPYFDWTMNQRITNGQGMAIRDAEFMSAARAHVPALCKSHEMLRKENEALRRKLGER